MVGAAIEVVRVDLGVDRVGNIADEGLWTSAAVRETSAGEWP
jgi:hypothetical protein